MGRSPRGGDCRELDRERAHVTGIGATGTVDFTGDIPEQVHAVHPDGVDVVLHFAGAAADVTVPELPPGRYELVRSTGDADPLAAVELASGKRITLGPWQGAVWQRVTG